MLIQIKTKEQLSKLSDWLVGGQRPDDWNEQGDMDYLMGRKVRADFIAGKWHVYDINRRIKGKWFLKKEHVETGRPR